MASVNYKIDMTAMERWREARSSELEKLHDQIPILERFLPALAELRQTCARSWLEEPQERQIAIGRRVYLLWGGVQKALHSMEDLKPREWFQSKTRFVHLLPELEDEEEELISFPLVSTFVAMGKATKDINRGMKTVFQTINHLIFDISIETVRIQNNISVLEWQTSTLRSRRRDLEVQSQVFQREISRAETAQHALEEIQTQSSQVLARIQQNQAPPPQQEAVTPVVFLQTLLQDLELLLEREPGQLAELIAVEQQIVLREEEATRLMAQNTTLERRLQEIAARRAQIAAEMEQTVNARNPMIVQVQQLLKSETENVV